MAQHAGAPVFEHMNDVLAPIFRRNDTRRCAIFEHRIQRQIEDRLFVVDVPIEAHRACAEAIGQATHLQSVDALGIQQLHRGRHDPFQRELTVFVVDHDMSKLEVLTSNVKDMFGEALPAQTLIPVPKLAIDPMLFEVEAVVVLD